MNIAFEIDGVLTDFEWFRNVYGKKGETTFSKRRWMWYVRKMPIRENAAVTINKLRCEGHKVYFITKRALTNDDNLIGKIMRRMLKSWLRKNRVGYDGIYYVSVPNSAREKRKICEKLNIEVMVEDEPDSIRDISQVCRVVCMMADYNEMLENMNYAMDFGDVYRLIHEDNYRDFRLLSHQERVLLAPDERQSYFSELSQYYKSLPFDKEYYNQCRQHMRKVVPIPRFLLRVIYGIKVVEGNVPIDTKGAIFVCNHRASLDVYMSYVILNKVRARVLTKREYEERKIGLLMRYMGNIFMRREDKKSRKSALNLMIQTLLHDGNIYLFPEGTRNQTDKTLLPFKYGVVYMAQITGSPIIPITIERKSKREHIVRIGESMRIDYIDDLTVCKQRLEEKMERMLEVKKDI